MTSPPPPAGTRPAPRVAHGRANAWFEWLDTILSRTAFRHGDDYVRTMTESVACVLGVRYAVIGRLHTEAWRAVTLGLWADGGLRPNIEYELAGTPCETVVDAQPCCYPSDVQSKFPGDRMLAEMGVQSYAAAPTFDSSGRPLGLIAVLDDRPMTEERGAMISDLLGILSGLISTELERQRVVATLERSQAELAAASSAKSRFLANMSHEIRTPLNGVIGSANLLEQTALDAEQRELVATIGECGHLLLAIIQDVLDLSSIEAGGFRLERNVFRVDELLGRLEVMFRVQARERGIELSLHAGRGDLCVAGDLTRLRQVLVNLVGNALKFTDRGAVAVRALAAEAGESVELTLEVEDSGCGVPDAMREQIFQPFRQVDDSATRRHAGAGLGLAICREIVDAMAGTIECLPRTAGRGTLFRVRVRLERAAPAPAPVAAPWSADAAAGTRVLLVEDNPINRRVATRMLECLGCSVAVARDGGEALAVAAAGPYDVVFMDCQMPVMDGLTATESLRAAGHEMPIVAMTAHALVGDAQRCRDAGMSDFLSKPVTVDALRRMLQRWARSDREP